MTRRKLRHIRWLLRNAGEHIIDELQFRAVRRRAIKAYSDENWTAYVAARKIMWHKWRV